MHYDEQRENEIKTNKLIQGNTYKWGAFENSFMVLYVHKEEAFVVWENGDTEIKSSEMDEFMELI